VIDRAGVTEGLGAADGLVVVDKPAGWTSHDVVGRIRRLAGTRRVGHAGTLDPMATGVLVVGVGRATRLLGHLALHDKDYDATLRLGVRTVTDDADGEVVETRDASAVSDAELAAAMRALVGDIDQVPSSVSAVKVDGERAYRRVRQGEAVELAPRRVHVERFDVVRRSGDDVDVAVTCSTGTYVRALARDVGAALGVGAHLTALRRTRVGAFDITEAKTLDELAADFAVVGLADAVARAFPRLDVDGDTARRLGQGQRVEAASMQPGPHGVFTPAGDVVALAESRDRRLRTLVVFAPVHGGTIGR
jgi:tRNA pseudouridine55 synthase